MIAMQGLFLAGGGGAAGSISPGKEGAPPILRLFSGNGGANGDDEVATAGAAMFEMEYARWLDDDQKHISKLRAALHGHLPDGELRAAVDDCVAHYDDMFQLKGAAAKSDVFHLITGMWTSPAERCFLWMGGFRPSEMIKVSTVEMKI